MKIKNLYYNRCCIKLKKSESDFLSNSLNENSSSREIRNKLIDLYNLSDVRYYSLKNINEITKNLKEALGRNYQSIGDVEDLIVTHKDVFLQNTGALISPQLCFNTGMYAVEIKLGSKVETLKFSSEEEMKSFFNKIKIHNFN